MTKNLFLCISIRPTSKRLRFWRLIHSTIASIPFHRSWKPRSCSVRNRKRVRGESRALSCGAQTTRRAAISTRNSQVLFRMSMPRPKIKALSCSAPASKAQMQQLEASTPAFQAPSAHNLLLASILVALPSSTMISQTSTSTPRSNSIPKVT